MRPAGERRIAGMILITRTLRTATYISTVALALALAGCSDVEIRSPASGPGVENPAAAGGGDVIPAIGGAGNGGGISGGGAGIGSGGQGSR